MAVMEPYRFQVQVEPGYLPEQSAPSRGRYTFSHSISIRNTGEVGAQLVSRHWDIEDADGGTQTVDGLGVVGHQPLLQPGESFEYTSGAQLHTAHGMMSGHFFCVAVDGTRFEVEVPPFVLSATRASDADLH